MSQKSGDSPDWIGTVYFQGHPSRLPYGLPLQSISLTVMYHVFYTDTTTTTFLPQSLLIYHKNNVAQPTSTQTNGGATLAIPT